MQPQEVNQAMASSAVQELQAVIAGHEYEFQRLFAEVRRAVQGVGELSESADLTDDAVDNLRWAVDTVRTELREAQQALLDAGDRIAESVATLEKFR